MAAAQGCSDGEAIPLGMLETIVRRIVDVVDLPVTALFLGETLTSGEIGGAVLVFIGLSVAIWPQRAGASGISTRCSN